MQCLYCGKGIGPIRQLRDLEFCSEAHRTEFRERYRRRLYADLAPDPPPGPIANFLEGRSKGGPVPRSVLSVLPKPVPEMMPDLAVQAAGIFLAPADWAMSGQEPMALPARAVWQKFAAAFRPAIQTPRFSVEIELSCYSAAGVGQPQFAMQSPAVRLPAAAAGLDSPVWNESAAAFRASIQTQPFAVAVEPPCRSAAGVASPQLTPQIPAVRLSAAAAALESALWHESAAAFRTPIQNQPFPVEIEPPCGSLAGAAAPQFTAQSPAVRLPATAAGVFEAQPSVPCLASLPEAVRTLSPVQAEHSSPRFQTAVPAEPELAAVGPVAPAVRAARMVASSITIAPPAIGLTRGAIAAGPQLADAGPLPVRSALHAAAYQPEPLFEARGSHIGTMAPQPPAMAGYTRLAVLNPASVEPHLSGVSGAVRLAVRPAPVSLRDLVVLALKARTADALPAMPTAASPARQAPRAAGAAVANGATYEPADPRVDCLAAPIGALAGMARPASASVQEASGNQDPRYLVVPAPLNGDILDVHHEWTAAASEVGFAPPCHAAPSQSAAPSAAAPSWDASLGMQPERLLMPSADITLPPIVSVPAVAGAIDGSDCVIRPDAGRAVRSCAVLWTLRVARMYSPSFRADVVRARFNELLRGATPYVPDAEDTLPAKNNLRPFKRIHPPAPAWKRKAVYIGAAAAALLLAGVLRPPIAAVNFRGWRDVSVRQWMTSRATRNFEDDFRAGLNQWKSMRAQLPKSWSYNSDGFVHPGQLALYRPSVPLSDYRFEFMAQIESKSVDWVVRAQDADNYYALKFTVLQPGPRPVVAMVRYPVIEGNRGARVQTPVRMMVHANTPYRVTVDVKGNRYRTFIEGQEADFWTDDRLKRGGVGFFSEAGERARVYWVKLESHGDILGRICGLLSAKAGDRARDNEKEAMDYRPLSLAAWLHLDSRREEAVREVVRVVDVGERPSALYFASPYADATHDRSRQHNLPHDGRGAGEPVS